MKSEIGFIVNYLFRDKYPKTVNDRLNGKQRIKLQKSLSNLINCNESIPIILSEEKLIEYPPRFEDEFEFNKELNNFWLFWLQKTFRKLYYGKI